MADRTFYPSFSYGRGRVYGEFQFTAPAAAASVALSAVTGSDSLTSITHTGGGNVVTCKLKDKFNKLIFVGAECRDTAGGGGGLYCTVGNVVNEGSSTVPPSFDINYFAANGSASNDSALVTMVCFAARNTAETGPGSK